MSTEPDNDGRGSTFGRIVRTLRSRNYRLFFSGQGISLIGTWITRIATSWLVWKLSHDEWQLGLVTFAGQIPIPLLSPIAGVWVDRVNRHKLLVAMQVAAMLQSLALAWLAYSGAVAVWHVMALAVVQGIINAIETPARQAFLIEMIEDRRDLSNGIALNSSMFNAARLIGPALGGWCIALVSDPHSYRGEALCFFVDGISYLAVIAALLAMRLPRYVAKVHTTKVIHGLIEGFLYAFRFAPIRAILTLVGVVSLMGISNLVLMPAVAANVLHGGADTYGWLMAASGVGALVGAIFLASRSDVRGLGRVIIVATSMFGGGLILFSLCGQLPAPWNLICSFLALTVSGFGMMVQMASGNTILQTIVDDDKRGRVMGFYTVSALGTAALGSLISGALANAIGPQRTLAVGGAVCLLVALAFSRQLPLLREQIRPIYRRMGILPSVADGLQTAAEVSQNRQE